MRSTLDQFPLPWVVQERLTCFVVHDKTSHSLAYIHFEDKSGHPPPVIARTVKVEVQRHSPVAKEASPAKDVSSVGKEASPAKDVPPVVSTAKADTKKSKHYKPKVLARQRNNYRYGNALGYAEESRNGSQRLFSNW